MAKEAEHPDITIEVCPFHSGCETRLDEHERRLNDGGTRMAGIEGAIGDIRETLLGRPTWGVTVLVSGLAAACGILLTALLAERREPPPQEAASALTAPAPQHQP